MATLLVFVPTNVGATTPKTTVFASGLNNPRGLTFGEDGALFVAEGGTGGPLFTTAAQCVQVPAVGPYTGGKTASISRISRHGAKTTLVPGLASSQTTAQTGGFVSGVSDVAVQADDRLFALIAGAGCSHGLAGTSNEIVRVHENGSTTPVADLSKFLMAHPVAHPDPDDFEPDGTWYSFVTAGRDFYAVEPNHQELDKITSDGQISRVVDFSKEFPGDTHPTRWVGPTALTRHGDSLYIGTLTPFPTVPGNAEVWKVNPRTGSRQTIATNLTSVLSVRVGEDGALYVLEGWTSFGTMGPAKDSGMVLRIKGGERTVIADHLSFPTAMTFGPEGDLYVSNHGIDAPGKGEILKIALNAEHEHERD